MELKLDCTFLLLQGLPGEKGPGGSQGLPGEKVKNTGSRVKRAVVTQYCFFRVCQEKKDPGVIQDPEVKR